MQRCNQKTCRDSNAFGDIIVFIPDAVVRFAIALRKHYDQPGRGRQMRLVNTGANRFQSCQPFITSTTCIKRALFVFGRRANLGFHRRIADGREMPRLMICPAGGAGCCLNAGGNHLLGHISVGKLSDGMTFFHVVAKSVCGDNRLILRHLNQIGQRQRLIRNLALAIHFSRLRSTHPLQTPMHRPEQPVKPHAEKAFA